MLSLGNALGVTVLAEGVETVDQWRVLRELGCTLGQGFHFARPLPPNEFRATCTGHADQVVTGGASSSR